MSSGEPSSRPPWTVVRVVDLSPSRRRLEYVMGDGTKRHAVIDRELDTPAMRERVADALIAESFRVATTRGPETRPPVRPSPWIDT